MLDTEFWVGEKKVLGRWIKWKPATMCEAAKAFENIGVHGLACFVLAERPLNWWQH